MSELLAASLVAWTLTAGDRDQARKLHEASDWMETRGDCRTALRLFHEVAKGPDRNVAARALLYSAICQEKLGQAEASATYQRLVREFPDQRTVAGEAKARLSEIGTWAGRIRRDLVDIRVARTIPVGALPSRVIVAPSRPEAYVATRAGVTVLDTRRYSAVHEIPLGEPVTALGVTPDGTRVLAGHASGKLRLIDTSTWIATTVSLQGRPVNDLCVTPDSRWAYVALMEYGIKKVDLTTRSVLYAASALAVGLALTPNGRMLFASLGPPTPGSSPGRNAIGWFDGGSGLFVNAITGLPLVASWLTLTPDGSQLWVATEDACARPDFDHRGCPVVPGGAIHVISTANQKLIRTLGFASGVGWAAPFPDGSLMALGGPQALRLTDTRTFEIIRSVPLMTAGSLAFTSDGSTAYVPLFGEPSVAVIEFAASPGTARRP